MRNKAIDLNNHLFAQLERITDEDISDEKLKAEIERSKAMCNLAKGIIENQRNVLKAVELVRGEKIRGHNLGEDPIIKTLMPGEKV